MLTRNLPCQRIVNVSFYKFLVCIQLHNMPIELFKYSRCYCSRFCHHCRSIVGFVCLFVCLFVVVAVAVCSSYTLHALHLAVWVQVKKKNKRKQQILSLFCGVFILIYIFYLSTILPSFSIAGILFSK